MIWSADSAPQQNVLTVAAGIPANAAGVAYAVSFDVAPAVYQNPSQATTTDQLRIDVLRADDSILQTYFSTPGAWAGSETFHLDGFRYVGDGSGDVRLRIMAASVTGRFAGAIDNLTVSFAVPEPATLTLLGAGLLGLLVCARRKRR
jgi:hypothetical protein